MRRRYYIVGVKGYPVIPGSATSGTMPAATSYSILDRDQCHREVRTFYAGGKKETDIIRHFRAWEECRRMNRRQRELDYADGLR
jgi:hypothetical protein